MAESIQNPHDALVRTLFQRKESAEAYLRGQVAQIDPRLPDRLDWSGLKLCPTSFIDAGMRSLHSDLVFELPLDGRPAFLYCLLEHQSSVDRLMPFRMLGYIAGFWKQWLDQHPQAKSLPPVLPLVLHTGAPAWKPSCRLSDLVEVPDDLADSLRKHQPDLQHLLLDLSSPDWEPMAREAVLRTTLALIHAAAMGRIEKWVSQYGLFFDDLAAQKDGKGIVHAWLWYVFRTANRARHSTIKKQLLSLGSNTIAKETMTIAEALEKKGLQKGRKEGLWVGQIRAFQKVLGQAQTPEDSLHRLPIAELKTMAEDLEKQVVPARRAGSA